MPRDFPSPGNCDLNGFLHGSRRVGKRSHPRSSTGTQVIGHGEIAVFAGFCGKIHFEYGFTFLSILVYVSGFAVTDLGGNGFLNGGGRIRKCDGFAAVGGEQ